MIIEVTLDMDTIIIATHYCPPRRDDAELLEVLTKLSSFRQPLYFFGDLNAAHQDFGPHRSNAIIDAGHQPRPSHTLWTSLLDLVQRPKTRHTGPDANKSSGVPQYGNSTGRHVITFQWRSLYQ